MPEIPRVSIVTAVRNGVPCLEQAVERILAQPFTDFEAQVRLPLYLVRDRLAGMQPGLGSAGANP